MKYEQYFQLKERDFKPYQFKIIAENQSHNSTFENSRGKVKSCTKINIKLVSCLVYNYYEQIKQCYEVKINKDQKVRDFTKK